MIHLATRGDRVRITIYEDEIVGVFDRHWGYTGEEGGWIIKDDSGYETWVETRDIEKCEILISHNSLGT